MQTDEQLLRRLAEVPPEALRRDEIARLKNRLVESAMLRGRLLADEQQRDDARAALARIGVTLDDVLAEAEKRRTASAPRGVPGWVWGLGLLGASAGVVLVIVALRGEPTQDDPPTRMAETIVQKDDGVDDKSNTLGDPKASESIEEVIETSPLPANPDPEVVKGVGNKSTANPQAVGDAFPAEAHPLQYELSKEGFNVAAELKQALDNKAYAGALHVIANRPPETDLGLLGDVVDPQLLIPYQAMVRQAMRDHPPLRDLMRQRYAATAQLRLRRAIAQIDPLAVQSVAIRFVGTAAAAEAEAWLGDRALSGGQFVEAVSRYERGLSAAAASQRHGIAARLRLAGAMIGREIGRAVKRPVVMGSATIEPAEFEKMVGQMLRRSNQHDDRRPRGGMAAADLPPAPAPKHYRTKPFAEVSGGSRGWRQIKRPELGQDWAARGMSSAVYGDLLLVSNRSQLFALERSTGKQRWQANFVAARGGPPTWHWLPMHPLIADERIYVRRLTRAGPELTCVDATTGTVLWSSIPREENSKAGRRGRPGSHVASDPLWVDGKLLALVATTVEAPRQRGPARTAPRLFQLALVAYDPATGRTISSVDLIQLRDLWRGVLPARAAPAGDGGGIVVSVGGVTLRIDAAGSILWLRRQRWRGQQADDPSWQQYHSRPLLRDGRVFVFQPGMRGVECLDLDSGRALWQRDIPGVRRIIGLVGSESDGQLIVRDAQGLLAVDANNGNIDWRRPFDNLLETYACGDADRLLIAHHHLDDNQRGRIELLWLDPATGATRANCPLDGLAQRGDILPAAQLGPLLLCGERIFVGFDPRGDNKDGRKLIELIATGKPLPPPADD